MFNWLACVVAGRHDYDIRCEPGTIFLKCAHCGHRSPGWILDEHREAARARLERLRAEASTQRPAGEHAR